MADRKRAKPAPVGAGTGLNVGNALQAVSDTMLIADLADHQAQFIAGRYRLKADRARLVVELAWGRA